MALFRPDGSTIVAQNPGPFCPALTALVSSPQGTGMAKAACAGPQCLWYVIAREECAVSFLARALLDSQRGNTLDKRPAPKP